MEGKPCPEAGDTKGSPWQQMSGGKDTNGEWEGVETISHRDKTSQKGTENHNMGRGSEKTVNAKMERTGEAWIGGEIRCQNGKKQ